MNLLAETIERLVEHGKTPGDVLWVGGEKIWFTWEDFAELADREYDEGFGGQEVARDLVIVGNGWHLERAEYDGSEWWNFVEPLKRPEAYRKPNGLFAQIGWEKLAEIDKAAGPGGSGRAE